MVKTIKLRAGSRMKEVQVLSSHGRLFFQFAFNKKLKNEIKVMEGWDYHGYEGATHQDMLKSVFGTDKIWSVKITTRNAFQLDYMMGGDPYVRWEAPPVDIPIPDRRMHKTKGLCHVYDHQKMLCRTTLARHFAVWAAEMRSGKTLAAILLMEHVGRPFWFVGPKSAIASVRVELNNWGCKNMPRLMTYDELKKVMQEWRDGDEAPFGVFFDESHFLKTHSSQRSKAARALADGIREDYCNARYWIPGDDDPYVICMTGSPAPKGPDDFHNQCEIAAPGFLREGDPNAFKYRLGLFAEETSAAGWNFQKKLTWLDNEKKCAVCGDFAEDHTDHDHMWIKSVNEVDQLYRRMEGLTTVLFTRDCIDMEPRIYRRIHLEPRPATLRAARLIAKSASRSVECQILLRELSDGFQYIKDDDGKRTALDADSPKEEALQDILESHEEDGRLVVYAGFTESIDKCIKVAMMRGWHVIRWDSHGVKLMDSQGGTIFNGPDYVIRAFNDKETFDKVCFVAQGDSAGTGLNLSVADEIVYYSNSFKADSRIQTEARCDAPDKRGTLITDLCHLPTDELVLANLQEKKDVQAIAMGDILRVLAAQEERNGEIDLETAAEELRANAAGDAGAN